MSKTPLQGGNPGWAGELGEFAHLKEADVRGTAYVGERPVAGIDAGGINAYPYQLEQHQPTKPLFEGPYRERLDKILTRYPNKQGALIPVLNLAHEIHGYISPDDMDLIARVLELSPAYVRGVTTFYTMYNRRPVGQYFIQVCTNVACNLCGADDVLELFCEAAEVEPGQVSADGLFTVMEAECLGACGFPTAVQINSQYCENVNADDAAKIVETLRARARSQARNFDAVPEEIRRTIDVAAPNGHGGAHLDETREVPR